MNFDFGIRRRGDWDSVSRRRALRWIAKAGTLPIIAETTFLIENADDGN